MKFDISKEWCEKMARLEIGHDVSAGNPFEHLVQCPNCRGLDLEKSWCDTCNRTGVVNQQPAGLIGGCMKNLLVSVSGGRTSMFMAIFIWLNWRSKYDQIIFVFANTGAEHPLTLKFVDYVAYIWGIPIVWVEAVVDQKKGNGTGYKVVNFETASRNYEPFDAVVNKYGIANKSYPHCNRELKLAPIHAYATDVFGGSRFKNYDTAIGIRVDEIDRMSHKAGDERLIYPLIGSKPMSKPDVLEWWKDQVYDLEIPEHYGNCLTCHKKSDRKLATISIEHPEWFDKPRLWESNCSMIGSKDGNPRKIYRGNKTVADIFEIPKNHDFIIFTDGNFSGSPLDIDVDESCTHECAPS